MQRAVTYLVEPPKEFSPIWELPGREVSSDRGRLFKAPGIMIRAEEATIMVVSVVGQDFRIPHWVRNLRSFRRWARSPEFPQHGRFSFLDGNLMVDVSMEKLVHNLIKSCICGFLTVLVKQEELGTFVTDRMLLSNIRAELSTEPDGMFWTRDTRDAGRVRLIKRKESVEVLGSPDMTLEVISASSVEKDTVLLPRQYWLAKVPEFWLVDSRDESPRIEIFQRGKSKYVAARTSGKWVESVVFGRWFRLVSRANDPDDPNFVLEMKA
jgi:Uma2 family endonuclease